MSNNIASQEVATRYQIYGRTFTVTRTTWKNSSGLSFDVADEETGFALHNESFDDLPDISDVANLIDQLVFDLNHGALDGDVQLFWDVTKVQRFAQTLIGGGYLKLSLSIDNRYEDGLEVATAVDDKVVPAPVLEPVYTVHYRIVTGIDNSSVFESTETVGAADEETAVKQVIDRVRETNNFYDDRIDPHIEILSVRELASGEQRVKDWAEDTLAPFAGTSARPYNEPACRITIRECSDTTLVGKTFDFGY